MGISMVAIFFRSDLKRPNGGHFSSQNCINWPKSQKLCRLAIWWLVTISRSGLILLWHISLLILCLRAKKVSIPPNMSTLPVNTSVKNVTLRYNSTLPFTIIQCIAGHSCRLTYLVIWSLRWWWRSGKKEPWIYLAVVWRIGRFLQQNVNVPPTVRSLRSWARSLQTNSNVVGPRQSHCEGSV